MAAMATAQTISGPANQICPLRSRGWTSMVSNWSFESRPCREPVRSTNTKTGARAGHCDAWTRAVNDAAGRIVFAPLPNQFGEPYASFAFTAHDGEVESAPATVGIIIGRPYAATQSPTETTAASATLNGMATPNGLSATAWFEWGNHHRLRTDDQSDGSGRWHGGRARECGH